MSRSDLQANGFNVEAYDLMLHGYTANNVATFSYLGMDGEFSEGSAVTANIGIFDHDGTLNSSLYITGITMMI